MVVVVEMAAVVEFEVTMVVVRLLMVVKMSLAACRRKHIPVITQRVLVLLGREGCDIDSRGVALMVTDMMP